MSVRRFYGSPTQYLIDLGLTALATQSPASVAFTGGSINGTSIGASTAASGTFTNLSAVTAQLTSASIYGGSINASSIGSVTPSTGAFTTLSASGAATFNGAINGTGAFSIYNSATLPTTASANLNVATVGTNTGNVDTIRVDYNRFATNPGSSWGSAYARIYRNVDATAMGFIQFGSATNNGFQDVEIGTGNTTFVAISGSGVTITPATTVSSTLAVTGATTLSSTLAVTGVATLNSSVIVTGSNNLVLKGASSGNFRIYDDGNAHLESDSILWINQLSAQPVTICAGGGAISIGSGGGLTTIGAALSVTGAATLSSTLSVTGAATISGNLSVPALASIGTLTVSGEMQSTSANAARFVQGNYGLIQRQDGATYYMLVTASGSQYGGWNGLRPFAINLASGNVAMLNGVGISGGLNADTITATSSITGTSIGNTGAFIQSGGNIALQMGPNAAIRDLTNGASTMYFDVSFGGTTNGAFAWRSNSAGRTSMYLDANANLTAYGSITAAGSLFAGSGALQISGNQMWTQTGVLYLNYSNSTGGVSINPNGGLTTIGAGLTVNGTATFNQVGNKINVQNSNDGGLQSYFGQTFGYGWLGLSNVSSSAIGSVPANSSLNVLAWSNTGQIGSVSGPAGFANGVPVFRNVLDDGAGNMVLNGNITANLGTYTGTVFTGNGSVNAQGAWLQWNKSGGLGETCLVNQRGGGSGGIFLYESTTANALTSIARLYTYGAYFNGSLSIGTGGNSGAGSIYSDSNWGMYLVGLSNPAIAHFSFRAYNGTELMRIDAASNIQLYGRAVAGNGVQVYDSNTITYTAGIVTEVSSQLIDFGINYSQMAGVSTSVQGGALRVDTRNGSPLFQFLGSRGGANVATLDNSGNMVLNGQISIAGNGSVAGGLTVSGALNHPSAPKAWVVFNGNGGIISSYNVSSITVNSTGYYTINLPSGILADANYSYSLGSSNPATNVLSTLQRAYNGTKTTTAFQVEVLEVYSVQGGSAGYSSTPQNTGGDTKVELCVFFYHT